MVAALAVLIVLPRATQGAALTVLTGSMTPQIPVGSVVLVRPVDSRTLKVGDVATYQTAPGKEEFITHRIVDIDTSTEPASFTFKGDANKGPDIDPVPAGAIRGEVWFHVPYLGAIRDALHGKAGLSLLAILLLGGYALVQTFGAVKDRRESRKPVGIDGSHDLKRIICDGRLLVATFRTSDVASAPCVLARSWGALLLSEDDQSFSVLLAQRPDNPMEEAHFLEAFHPTSITAIDSSALLTVSARSEHTDSASSGMAAEPEVGASIPAPSREQEHALA